MLTTAACTCSCAAGRGSGGMAVGVHACELVVSATAMDGGCSQERFRSPTHPHPLRLSSVFPLSTLMGVIRLERGLGLSMTMRLHSSSPPFTCNVGVGEVSRARPRTSWAASSFGQHLDGLVITRRRMAG